MVALNRPIRCQVETGRSGVDMTFKNFLETAGETIWRSLFPSSSVINVTACPRSASLDVKPAITRSAPPPSSEWITHPIRNRRGGEIDRSAEFAEFSGVENDSLRVKLPVEKEEKDLPKAAMVSFARILSRD